MRRLVMVTVLTSMVLGLSACDDDDPPSSGGGGGGGSIPLPTPQDTDPTPVESTPDPPEDPCAEASESGYDVALGVTTTNPAEVPYLDDFTVCTDGTDTGPVWLRNDGDAVWLLPAGTSIEWLEYSEESQVFDELFRPETGQVMLVPGDVLLADVPPLELRWDIDVARTVTWEVQGGLVDEAISYGGGKAADVLRTKSSTRAAVATCSLATFQLARGWREGADTLEKQVGLALTGVSGGAGCASSWDRAWSRRLEPSSTWLGEVDSTYSRASRFLRAARAMTPIP